jgi:hypothetical protein
MIIYTHQKSKKRKQTVKQRMLAEEWQKLVERTAPKKTIKVQSVIRSLPNLSVPPGREIPNYPSLKSDAYSCTKKETTFYTGSNMKGIGTLHKSNAVPIFTDEEARDQANMRR